MVHRSYSEINKNLYLGLKTTVTWIFSFTASPSRGKKSSHSITRGITSIIAIAVSTQQKREEEEKAIREKERERERERDPHITKQKRTTTHNCEEEVESNRIKLSEREREREILTKQNKEAILQWNAP